MPAILPQIPFRLHTAAWGEEGLIVAQFTAREELSRPYVIDALAFAPGALALEDLPALGEPATLTLAPSDMEDNGTRRFHGVLSRVTHDAVAHDRGGVWLRIRVVPRLWTLKHRRTRRIFQDRTVLQVIDAVLGAHNVHWRWAVDTQPQVIGYCVQYDETDFAFVHRLLARFGLFYYFEQGDADHGNAGAHEAMVVCDVARHYPALVGGARGEPRVLKLVDRHGTYRPVESVLAFSHLHRARPTASRLRDWEFTNPNAFSDAAEATTTEPSLGTETLQVDEFDYRSANDTIRVRRRDARTVLEQERAEVIRGTGSSDCAGLAPGYRYILNNHDVSGFNAAWVVTKVEHEGRVPEFARERRPASGAATAAAPLAVYLNRFECAPADVTVRPARPARRPTPTVETAVVVGPEGEEIYVDAYGRAKVQFLWDRAGTYNERSSCWLRVSQAWAGAGWGFQFIPRIGMEVIVTFVGGDPDHPLITGAVYNAMRMPTHVLPDRKSRSGIRTSSTPGGMGFNELAFEDLAGEEQVYLHAQRDLDEVVRRDHTLSVGGDERISVVGQRIDQVGTLRSELVGGDATTTITRDATTTVHGHVHEHVGRDQTVHIDGSRNVLVNGTTNDHTIGDRTTRIDGHERHDLARVSTEVRNEAITRVRGSHTVVVGTHAAPRSFVVAVEGQTTLSSTGPTEIESTEEIVVRCGTSVLRIGPHKIELDADALVLRGKDTSVSLAEGKATIRAKTQVLAKSDTVVLKSSGAIVKLDGDAKIDGGSVKLKSSASVDDSDPTATAAPTTIVLQDTDGNALAGQRYVVVLADGSERTGVVDETGTATLAITGSAQAVFPDAGGRRPLGPPVLSHVVRQGEDLAWLAFTLGFDANAVWNHDANRALRELRRNSQVLAPGDVLHVPDTERDLRPLAVGGSNRFHLPIPKQNVTLVLPSFANMQYQSVAGPGQAPVSGTADGDGRLQLQLPVLARSVRLRFPERQATYTVQVGHLDPVSERAGVHTRLQHLGYLLPSPAEHLGVGFSAAFYPDDDDAVTLAQALAAFQRANDLEVTGQMNEATGAALCRVHGS